MKSEPKRIPITLYNILFNVYLRFEVYPQICVEVFVFLPSGVITINSDL